MDLYILLIDLDPDPEGPKRCESCGSGSPTLSENMLNLGMVSTTYSCYNPIPHSLVLELSRVVLGKVPVLCPLERHGTVRYPSL
jgi:hypothetical protein